MFGYLAKGRLKFINRRALLNGILVISLTVLTMAQSAISALVLCQSDGGHRAIEIAHHDGCRQIRRDFDDRIPGANTPSASALSVSTKAISEKVMTSEGYSTTCVDIPLGNEIIAHHISPAGKSLTRLIRLTLFLTTTSISSSVTSTVCNFSPHVVSLTPIADATLVALRSVVLLN